MIHWLASLLDQVADIVSPLDDAAITSRYRALGPTFLLTASDRELRRLADLVRAGEVEPLLRREKAA